MGNLSIDLEWCASWMQNNNYHCSLFIKRDYFDNERFGLFLIETFGSQYGAWHYDKHIHGVNVWFYKKQDMLTFKLLTKNKTIEV